MKEYLSETEILKIDAFCKDEVMFEAVKKVLLVGIYENGVLIPGKKSNPTRNFALSLAFKPEYSDEKIGSDLRAQAAGILFVEKGFEKLTTIIPQPIKSPVDMTNPAS